MFSLHYQGYFHKKLDLHIVKNENPQVFYQELEVITRAIQKKKKIRFCYQKPSLKQQNSGKITELAPIDTVFSNNEYYLLCQGARNSNDCIQYRLDYIKNVEIIEDSSVYFSPTESYTEFYQSYGRCYRNGQTKKVTAFKLITEDTIESDIYNALDNKQDFNFNLWEKEKLKK